MKRAMLVRLQWDEEELGESWMNKDNLAALLYGKTFVSKEHLKATIVKNLRISWDDEEVVDESSSVV